MSLHSPKLSIRKKEQRGPEAQIFRALSTGNQKLSKVVVLQSRPSPVSSATPNDGGQPGSNGHLKVTLSSKPQTKGIAVKGNEENLAPTQQDLAEIQEAERAHLLQLQTAKQKALLDKQLEEARSIKAEYQQLKALEAQKFRALDSQKQQKLQAKKALQVDLESKKSSIDVDQLLDFVHDQRNATKKRKRAVLQDSV
ncbi:hypothetical protein CC86DRAFT_413284 [Ophiobolus disseminans]|uniref:Uncharacterized protein n=1 Tax=Ophiobolus disseminans TaxID=1469910 RepID=A0A6A6ZET8_9PLEO|nr:hypothetical protein CC86DRAFT_413284 [Ophiobolus disseminans]